MSDRQMLPPTRAMIGKWSVDRYVTLLRRWAIVTALLVALLTLTSQSRAITVGIEILAVVLIGWMVTRRDGGKTESVTAGAFFGIMLGLASSMSRFVLQPTIASASMIIVETILSAVVATLIAVSAGLLTTIIQQKN